MKRRNVSFIIHVKCDVDFNVKLAYLDLDSKIYNVLNNI